MNKLASTHVYQAFYSDHRIKGYFYAGDAFMGYREDHSVEELMGLVVEIMKEDDGKIMPKLTEQIENLLGKENFVYDFWEFGPECFSLYWWMGKEVYQEKIKLIRQWADTKGLVNIWK